MIRVKNLSKVVIFSFTALYIWTLLVSIPALTLVSQITFSLLLTLLVYELIRGPYFLIKKRYVAARENKYWAGASKFRPQINLDQESIDGNKISTLLKRHGSPLYLASGRALNRKINRLRGAINKYTKKYRLAYSIKTNSVAAIVKVFKNSDFLAEAVSDFEYSLAKKLKFKDHEIIYNGPDKSGDCLKTALLGGAIVNVDNSRELKRVIKMANGYRRKISIGIRVNTSSNSRESRFGFNLESGKADLAVSLIESASNIKLTGVHIHLGSNIQNPREFANASSIVCRWIKQRGLDIKYLDFGGGFPVVGSSPTRYSFFEHNLEDFISAIITPINLNGLRRLNLILEPGRFLIDEPVVLISSVLHSEKRNGLQMVTTNASINILPLAKYRLQKIDFVRKNRSGGRLFKTNIYGRSCMENDKLVSGARLPRLTPHDVVIFYNAGAYNITQSNQMIFPRPGVVMTKAGSANTQLIREPETTSDLVRKDEIN